MVKTSTRKEIICLRTQQKGPKECMNSVNGTVFHRILILIRVASQMGGLVIATVITPPTWVIMRVWNNVHLQWISFIATHRVGDFKSLLPCTTRRIVKWKHLKDF